MRAILLAAVLLLPVAASAADDRLDGLVAAINEAGAAPAREAATVGVIARAVGLSTDALRADRAQAELPWGDLFVSHRIAARSGHPIAKVFAARWTGASWTLIAEEANVDAAALEQDLLAAFPGLTPVAVPVVSPRPTPPASPPVASPPPPEPAPAPGAPAEPPAPAKSPAPAPEKKRSLAERFLDLFKGEPAAESPEDKRSKREEELRDFLRGKPRPR